MAEVEFSSTLDLGNEDNTDEDDFRDIDGFTLTHRSAAVGNTESLIVQVKRDATLLEIVDHEGQTPLMHAVVNQQMETTRILIKMGAAINRQNRQGQTPLSMAAYRGWYDGVVFLLRNGARALIVDKQGRSALHASTYPLNINVMLVLLQSVKQIDLNHQDFEGMTALHWACFHNRPDHMALLLESNAPATPTDVDGKTPLHWAAQNGGTRCCQILLSHPDGPDLINQSDYSGKTGLHYASAAGQLETLRVLLSCPGVFVDSADPDDRTPLHWAAAKGESKCVSLLLAHGANPHRQDLDSCTALHYAQLSGCQESMRILSKFSESGEKPSEKAGSSKSFSVSDEGATGSRGGWKPLNFISDMFSKKSSASPAGDRLRETTASPIMSVDHCKEEPQPSSSPSSIHVSPLEQASSSACDGAASFLPLPPLMALSVADNLDEVMKEEAKENEEKKRTFPAKSADDQLRTIRKPALPSIPSSIPSIALQDEEHHDKSRRNTATSSDGLSTILEDNVLPLHTKASGVLPIPVSPRPVRKRSKKKKKTKTSEKTEPNQL